MQFSIVYEDPDILVINKPAGISVHKTHPADPHETLADFLVAQYPYLKSVGDLPAGRQGINLRPGIVHRLDKETSGLMIIAKNQDAFLYFKKLFQERSMRKSYTALVHGRPPSPQGTIDTPLGKVGTKQTTQLKGRRQLVERDAVTDYETLKAYREYTLLDVHPRTGRTHQIRVHLKSIGTPVAGDTLYGPRNAQNPPGLTRLFLHARQLSFTAPGGQALTLETDLPEDLQKVLDVLQ